MRAAAISAGFRSIQPIAANLNEREGVPSFVVSKGRRDRLTCIHDVEQVDSDTRARGRFAVRRQNGPGNRSCRQQLDVEQNESGCAVQLTCAEPTETRRWILGPTVIAGRLAPSTK